MVSHSDVFFRSVIFTCFNETQFTIDGVWKWVRNYISQLERKYFGGLIIGSTTMTLSLCTLFGILNICPIFVAVI